MRVIKFRAQDVASNKWLYGDLRHHKEDVCIFEQGGMKGKQVKAETVGQFTGLLDKNGTEIYDGDILRLKTFKNLSMEPGISWEESKEMRKIFALDDLKGELETESVTVVCFEEGILMVSQDWHNDTYFCCLWGDQKRSSPIFECEVIGNIHDNPDIEMQYSNRFNKK